MSIEVVKSLYRRIERKLKYEDRVYLDRVTRGKTNKKINFQTDHYNLFKI